MVQLTQAYDVYVPALTGNMMKQDKEVNNYMASFFPRQSTLKFNIQYGLAQRKGGNSLPPSLHTFFPSWT